MGCASSALLNQDEEFPKIGGFSHHIVSLTSTTYGLLTLDPPTPPPPPPRRTLASLFPDTDTEPRSRRYHPLETINSWDLMSGIDSDRIPSFRFNPPSTKFNQFPVSDEPDRIPSFRFNPPSKRFNRSPVYDENVDPNLNNSLLEKFEMICPPNGENRVVMYSTTLRGVRKTFEDCNAVRSAVEGVGVLICERDISMDKGFRDELRELTKGKGINELIPPRLFVKGRYIGGVEEVMRVAEDGRLAELVQGLPKVIGGNVCDGCGGVRFLPCFTCNGSCKIGVAVMKEGLEVTGKHGSRAAVVRCSDCNENGLVLCPICS